MTNKKLPENATKTEGAELARRGRGEISTATAVPHVSYDDLRHAALLSTVSRFLPTTACIPRRTPWGRSLSCPWCSMPICARQGSTTTWMPRLITARCVTMSTDICASIRLSSSRLQLRVRPRCCCAVIPRCLVYASGSISRGLLLACPWQAAASRSSACANRF